MSGVPNGQGSPQTRELPAPGRYRHFKGGEYELLSVGKHTETGEVLVVYRSVDDAETVWVRPLEMFVSNVDRPDGKHPRFRRAKRDSTAVGRIAGAAIRGIQKLRPGRMLDLAERR